MNRKVLLLSVFLFLVGGVLGSVTARFTWRIFGFKLFLIPDVPVPVILTKNCNTTTPPGTLTIEIDPKGTSVWEHTDTGGAVYATTAPTVSEGWLGSDATTIELTHDCTPTSFIVWCKYRLNPGAENSATGVHP